MLFNSFNFLCIFLPITLLLYYGLLSVSAGGGQLSVLIVAGFVFYACNHLEFLALLIASGLINGCFSYWSQNSTTLSKRRFFALMGVVLNLCLLGFFKYGKLIYGTFFSTGDIGDWILALPLPIGISFYTFQGISLLMDVMRNDHNFFAERKLDFKTHIIHTVFFLSFFPHSVAGPIVKSYYFLPQIQRKYFHDINFVKVFKILIVGFFLKVVIADNIQNYTFWIAYPYFLSAGTVQLWIMMIGYSVQIFADFAGYSLIAIGIAALFGYHLPDNFNFPYVSTSFREFWRRWHMSLSAWLREYLYFSLGGNRKGKVRTYVNLMLVMFLGGFWHGAAWNYLAWGGVHGILLAIERYFLNTKPGIFFTNLEACNKVVSFCHWIIVFMMVSWAWLFFKLPDFSQALAYTQAMFTISAANKIGSKDVIYFCIMYYSLPVLAYHLIYYYELPQYIKKWKAYESIIYAVMLLLILGNGGTSSAFIYFQF